ncbi:DUF362 domain-containing protein [Anaeromyxobacter terrae]|uniref:DUF362 domain-containing protein n=1 Tax=Anaeromyxobacter terrae TaxID=2925406 RepID=UPI001F56779F|nr:DUF362 domain-containing protein [Anaeromyxobacter sp. SG22]
MDRSLHHRLGRRRFVAGALAGAASVAAVSALSGASRATPAGARSHALPDAPRPPATSTVAVVRPSASPSLRAAVEEAIRLAGGLGFIRPGDSVLLKPAVNSGNPYPATTDPEVVQIVARLVLEAGGAPFVADRTMFLHSTRAALERTGIRDAARSLGIPCIALEDAEVAWVRHPLAAHWPDRTIRIYRPVLAADHVIGLCTPRTHVRGDFTMAMKNAVGIVDGAARVRMHLGPGLRARLAEISLVAYPALVLLDAREGFADGGPDEGDRCRPDVIAASTDPLALDAVGLALLRIAGTNERIRRGSIWDIPMMRRAAEIGVGAASGERILLAGASEADVARLRRELG